MERISKPTINVDGLFAFKDGLRGLTTLAVVCSITGVDYKRTRYAFNNYFTRMVFDGILSKQVLCRHFFAFKDGAMYDGLDLAITSTGLLFLLGIFKDDDDATRAVLKLISKMLSYEALRVDEFIADEGVYVDVNEYPPRHLIADFFGISTEITAKEDASIYEYLTGVYADDKAMYRRQLEEITELIKRGLVKDVFEIVSKNIMEKK